MLECVVVVPEFGRTVGVTTYMHDAARALSVRDAIVVAMYIVVVE